MESGDLTGRARIRDAAVVLFGERGVERTSLREIAEAAGVTAGLVRHHFGSKDGLRDACDAYALDRIMTIKQNGVFGGRLGDAAFLNDVHPELLVLHRYLARSIIDGSPAAPVLLDRMIAAAEQWIADSGVHDARDTRGFAGVLAAAQIGMLVMRQQLADALQTGGPGSADGSARLSHALIDFCSTPLLNPSLAVEAHAALNEAISHSGAVTQIPGTREAQSV